MNKVTFTLENLKIFSESMSRKLEEKQNLLFSANILFWITLSLRHSTNNLKMWKSAREKISLLETFLILFYLMKKISHLFRWMSINNL
jgi:hypothetical protein